MEIYKKEIPGGFYRIAGARVGSNRKDVNFVECNKSISRPLVFDFKRKDIRVGRSHISILCRLFVSLPAESAEVDSTVPEYCFSIFIS